MQVILEILFVFILLIGCGGSNNSSHISGDNNLTTHSNNTNQDQNNTTVTDSTAYLGNLADANVSIYEVNTTYHQILLWNEKTSNGTNLNEIGNFNSHKNELKDDIFYIYEISGGIDWDSDDNGIKDEKGSENNGTISALLKGSEIKSQTHLSINYISSYLFDYLKHYIYDDDFDTLKADLIKTLFETSTNDINELSQLVNQYIPAEDFHNLSNDFKTYVPNMVENIKKNKLNNKESIITLNAININQSQIGNNGLLVVDVNLTSLLPLGNLQVFVGLENDLNNTFDIITLPTINKGTYIYPIEIDLSSYFDEDSNSTLFLSGITDIYFNIGGINFRKNLNISPTSFVKILDVVFEYDGDLTQEIMLDNYIEENGTIQDMIVDISSNIKELWQEQNLSLQPTVKIQNYFMDQNFSNISVENILIVDNVEYPLPMLDLNGTIDIENGSSKSLSLFINWNKTNVNNLLISMLSHIKDNISPSLVTPTFQYSSIEAIIEKNWQSISDEIITNNIPKDVELKTIIKDQDGNQLDYFTKTFQVEMNDNLFEKFISNIVPLFSGTITINDMVTGQ